MAEVISFNFGTVLRILTSTLSKSAASLAYPTTFANDPVGGPTLIIASVYNGNSFDKSF